MSGGSCGLWTLALYSTICALSISAWTLAMIGFEVNQIAGRPSPLRHGGLTALIFSQTCSTAFLRRVRMSSVSPSTLGVHLLKTGNVLFNVPILAPVCRFVFGHWGPAFRLRERMSRAHCSDSWRGTLLGQLALWLLRSLLLGGT